MRTRLFNITFTVLLVFCGQAAAMADSLDDYVTSQMQKRHIPGLSLVIVKDGKVIKLRGYGLASVEFDAPATKDSIYRIGSLTKPFTATAIMLLVEDGKIKLDDKITQYFTNAPASWGRITVRHLLTHTSGLLREATPYTFETVGKFYSRDEYMKILLKAPLEFQPGDKWSYSNSGYYLLAMIIEKASGKSYGEFLMERIFKPLGMNSTSADDTQQWFLQDVVKKRVTAYQWDQGASAFRVPHDFHPSQLFGCGNLISTASDLVKFDAALNSHTLLKKSTLEQMWTPVKLNNADEFGYGFGWQMLNPVGFGRALTYPGHKIIGHGGDTPGFSAQLYRFAQDRVSIILLCNTGGGDNSPFELSLRLSTLVIPDLAIPRNPITDTEPQVTQGLKRVLLGISEGDLDFSLCSPGLSALFSPERVGAIKTQFNQQNGPLKSLSLLDRRVVGTNQLYLYRGVFEKRTLLCYVHMTNEGKIDDLGWEPEAE